MKRNTRLTQTALTVMALVLGFTATAYAEESPNLSKVRHKTLSIEVLDIFYREAGDPEAQTLLLLHGFPT